MRSSLIQMMWAADFDESLACDLEENCLEALVLHLPRDSGGELKVESTENGNGSSNDCSQVKHGNMDHSISEDTAMKSVSAYPFCGLTRSFWSRSERMQISTVVSSTKNGDDELPVFCVAAILIMNRLKIIRETRSIDDMIKAVSEREFEVSLKNSGYAQFIPKTESFGAEILVDVLEKGNNKGVTKSVGVVSKWQCFGSQDGEFSCCDIIILMKDEWEISRRQRKKLIPYYGLLDEVDIVNDIHTENVISGALVANKGSHKWSPKCPARAN
ncbi:hypothetical protein GH714_005311 [Hevea brasiliensis]|uniref:Uncharacterized protein n=1 Tax=Hevea brasiliensis TaxID=3981 RepID=A0A6A6NAW0_HEVBR|nr:hypothetical protein GH714_005311 [Hevea brasiliensis]